MAGSKYDKYFVKEPLGTMGGFFPVVIANGARDYEGAEFSLRVHYITEPGVLVKEPHAHDFEQFYFLQKAAENFKRGKCHCANTYVTKWDKPELTKEINEEIIPRVTNRIIEILKPPVKAELQPIKLS